jgi:hypothetical protein
VLVFARFFGRGAGCAEPVMRLRFSGRDNARTVRTAERAARRVTRRATRRTRFAVFLLPFFLGNERFRE